jgi:hypothetical protein
MRLFRRRRTEADLLARREKELGGPDPELRQALHFLWLAEVDKKIAAEEARLRASWDEPA